MASKWMFLPVEGQQCMHRQLMPARSHWKELTETTSHPAQSKSMSHRKSFLYSPASWAISSKLRSFLSLSKSSFCFSSFSFSSICAIKGIFNHKELCFGLTETSRADEICTSYCIIDLIVLLKITSLARENMNVDMWHSLSSLRPILE